MSEQQQSTKPNQQQQQPQRYMPSIFKECDSLKQAYDKCFINFLQQFVSPDYKHETPNPCQDLHNIYRECLEKNLQLHKPYDIDLDELRKDILTNFGNSGAEKN